MCTRKDFWGFTETDLVRCQKTMSTCQIQFKMCVRVRCVNVDQVCEVCARRQFLVYLLAAVERRPC